MRRILSLDISTVSVGWAYREKDGVITHGHIDAKPSDHVTLRLRHIKNSLLTFISTYWEMDTRRFVVEEIEKVSPKGRKTKAIIPFDRVVIEKSFVPAKRSRDGAMSIGRANGIVEDVLLDFLHPHEQIMIIRFLPSDWRRLLMGDMTGKKKAFGKEDVKAYLESQGHHTETDDEEDALGMLLGYDNYQEVQ